MHAALSFEGGQLAGVDLLPGTYKPPQGSFVTIGIPTRDRAEAVFHALSEGGTIQMPFQQTFWSAGFGVLVDRFGIPWGSTVSKVRRHLPAADADSPTQADHRKSARVSAQRRIDQQGSRCLGLLQYRIELIDARCAGGFRRHGSSLRDGLFRKEFVDRGAEDRHHFLPN